MLNFIRLDGRFKLGFNDTAYFSTANNNYRSSAFNKVSLRLSSNLKTQFVAGLHKKQGNKNDLSIILGTKLFSQVIIYPNKIDAGNKMLLSLSLLNIVFLISIQYCTPFKTFFGIP